MFSFRCKWIWVGDVFTDNSSNLMTSGEVNRVGREGVACTGRADLSFVKHSSTRTVSTVPHLKR